MALSRPASSALWLLFAALWLALLGVRPLYKPDEARYGEIPREMVASSDWLTPRLNGFKYFEKPPLQYWATAAAFKVFGVSDWSARLWSGLAALAGIALVLAAGNRLFGPPAGAYAGAVLASSPLYLLLGQGNTLDMGVTLFLSAAAFAFAIAQGVTSDADRRRWMLGFWAACAAAVLSKGLIGIVLPLGAIALYVLLRRDWGLLARLELMRGGLLFLAIAAPWFVAVSLANPEFAHFFFVQEHWQRFTTHVHRREHPGWFFVPVLVASMAPWLLAVAGGWLASLRLPRRGAFSPAFFLGVWAIVVFAFFSLSGSKLPPYILPLVPALALLAGAFLARGERGGLLLAQALFTAACAMAIGAAAWRISEPAEAVLYGLGDAYAPWLAAAATAALAGAGAAAFFASVQRTPGAIAALAAGAAAALLVAFAGHRVFGPAYSVASLAAALPPPPPETRVFAVEAYDHTMPWALRRTVTMVGYKDELEQPIGWEPQGYMPDLASFARAWRAEREAYAFFAVRDFERLRAELGVPMEIAARGPRYVVVRKP
jgi:4-amino-4-deoxy-L-arabinose transferase-like glycosyltransferase